MTAAIEIPSRTNIAEWFLDRPARAHPERVAILGEPAAVTYGELRDLANRAGNALLAAGCARGDRVLIVLRDSAEFIAAFFGAAKIGAIPVPVNSFARAADYGYYLADCGAAIAIVDESALAEFLRGAGARTPKVIVVGGEDAAAGGGGRERIDWTGWTGWSGWIEAASEKLEPHPTSAHDAAMLLYTSGSGGQPKAAVHRHKDMLVATRSYADGVLGLRGDDRTFSVSKLFFAYGLGNGMYFPLSAGASTILNPSKTRIDQVAEIVARHRPTIFFSVPTFYAALLHEASQGLRVDFSSVRIAVSAGEPLPAEVFEQFRERFGIDILDGIGSTEMLHIFISNYPGRARAGTCGTVVPNYEIRIVGDDGRPCGNGEIGTLSVRGESAFAKYWRAGDETATGTETRAETGTDTGTATEADSATVDGWVDTGDKFSRDADGYYTFCGRSDDMIKVSGMWVSPVEVENALLGHDRVAEAAVIGVADAAGLLKPVAYVVLVAGSRPYPAIADAIREYLRARLVHYKCPREIHFVEELPKTVTGKIQRYLLRERRGRESPPD